MVVTFLIESSHRSGKADGGRLSFYDISVLVNEIFTTSRSHYDHDCMKPVLLKLPLYMHI